MKNSDDFKVICEEFDCGGTKRKRQVTVIGRLKNLRTTPTVTPATPLPLLTQPGTSDDRPLNTNAGHLIATQFGGPNMSENVVSLYAHFNQHGAWKALESELKKKLKQASSPVTVEINIEYGIRDGRIPSAFRVTATCNGEVSSFPEIVHQQAEPEYYEDSTEDIERLEAAHQQMVTDGWTMENESQTLKLPSAGIARPYAVLDYMTIKRDLPGVTISNGREFSSEQLQYIRTYNRIKNGGFLRPDAPDDPFYGQNLLSVAGDQGPHIDHIVPKATASGSNAYSNAHLLSGLGNMRKGTTR